MMVEIRTDNIPPNLITVRATVKYIYSGKSLALAAPPSLPFLPSLSLLVSTAVMLDRRLQSVVIGGYVESWMHSV